MAKNDGESISREETDGDLLDDPEDSLWESLQGYKWKDLFPKEKINYAKTIHTLNEEFGYSYSDIIKRTGWTESPGGLARRVNGILNLDPRPIDRKAVKDVNRQIGELIGREASQKVIADIETGRWLRETYGPLANISGVSLKQFIANKVDYNINERPELEERIDEIFEDDMYQRMLVNKLAEIASPNFLAAEKMRLFTNFTNLIILLKINGEEIPSEVSQAYMRELNEIEQKHSHALRKINSLQNESTPRDFSELIAMVLKDKDFSQFMVTATPERGKKEAIRVFPENGLTERPKTT